MSRTSISTEPRPRGRPRRAIANRPTDCPERHGGSITLWGRREWASAPFRRQRFRCVPRVGDPHTFSLARRPATHAHPTGEDCPTCDVAPGLAEGPVSRVDHFHTATEIGHLLQLVAQGMSLRKASEAVRIEAQRFVLDRHGMRHASTEHVLAARYLDLFGSAIDKELAPRVSPRILILDSKPLNLRAYGAEEVRAGWNTQERGGAVLVAMGMDRPGDRPMPWRIGIAGDETIRSWRDFLDEFDGDDPDWVVADGASTIAAAVARRWPTATFHNCEWHLGRLIRKAAKKDGIATDLGPHAVLFERAQWSEADWDALRAFAQSRGARRLDAWCAANDALIRQQVGQVAAFPGLPRGNAPAEAVLEWIDDHLDRSRRFSLRNAARLQLVLSLMRAHHAGQADLATFAAVVKRRMALLTPDDRFDWKQRQDPRTDLCSIGQLIVDAHDRAALGTASYMAAAKARSVIANVAEQNAVLAGLGLPPLVATVAAGRKTASVKVAGLMLLPHFPLVAKDWDHAANTLPLASVRAGSSYLAHWRCHRCGHTWTAPVVQRTGRQTRCQRCVTERADGLNSLAAIHPGLLPEWDAAANAPLRPDRIRATYDKTVSWQCSDPEHPPYRMSPVTRAKQAIGCPLCRRREANGNLLAVA